MGLSTWKDKYRYQGAEWPLEQFVNIAGEVLGVLAIGETSVPNERLVRYYTAEGVISRPGRDGREARYGWQHLVEFLVTRLLLNDGWPLSKVAEFMRTSDPESLESMLPEQPLTPAQREVRAIKSAMRSEDRDGFHDEASPRPVMSVQVSMLRSGPEKVARQSRSALEASDPYEPSSSASLKMLDLQGTMSRGRLSLAHLMHALGFGKHRPEWKDTVSIDLTPWCIVTFDAEQLRQLPPSVFEPLGEALAQSLREHRVNTRRERK